MMPNDLDVDYLAARISLGAAAGWTAQEMRVVADLGFALAEQGRHQEAIKIFEGLRALAPATGYFQLALGALYLRIGELAKAVEHLDAALKADGGDVAAFVNRGEAHMQLGNRAAAIADFQSVARLVQSQPEASATSHYAVRARGLLVQLTENR